MNRQVALGTAKQTAMGGQHDDRACLADGDAMYGSICFWEWLPDRAPAHTAVIAGKYAVSSGCPQPVGPRGAPREGLHAAPKSPVSRLCQPRAPLELIQMRPAAMA